MKKDIRTLVVGVDLSKYSKLVVSEAQELAKKWQVKIKYIFVHSELGELQKDYADEMTAFYKRRVQKFYKNLNLKDLTVLYGKPATEIIKFAKNFNSPLIVLGHRGFNPVYQMFLGSVAESVALSSPCPVWIHRGSKVVLPERILIPSDLTHQTDRTIMGVESLHSSQQKQTEVFHVSQAPVIGADSPEWPIVYEKMKEIETLRIKSFKKKHPNLQTTETMGGVAARIQERAKKFDIIALTPKDRNHGLPLFGSVTARLIRSGHKPVVIFP